ncbi:hypothetical protein [Enterobacter asburiae]|uniref:hypothetical protein n=1 Tax=Enterobacter asburiae TaxID=61645 RepID=UPI0021D3B65B|nr:hypothetical protein [Enterobacter asburiae]MCU6239940.1 hypothetical protein [Enterobacter asburiae]MCU6244263.1 hypothetical protein [Enterobacter asburiae]
MNKAMIVAAQARAASAVQTSNIFLWNGAKDLFKAGLHDNDPFTLFGLRHPYRKVNIDDVLLNYETYGDCAICDADLCKVRHAINLDLPDEAFTKCRT